MDLAAFEWLLTPPGQRLLERAAALRQDGSSALRVGELLRRDHSADRVGVALSQVELRERAVSKLGPDAARMYFTRDGLEQATRAPVAAHRAARLAAADPTSVLDLGCGIGADLIAFARAGITTAGVDLDPERVAVAAANLDALGLPGAVQVADALTVDRRPFGAVFADPARRSGHGRSLDPDTWQPPWSFAEELLREAACVKVAPGIAHDLLPDGVEAEWVSHHGDLVEAALWGGPLAVVRRRATVLGAGGLATLTEDDDPGPDDLDVGRVEDFLYEPDPAVIRAGLVTAVAAGVRGGLLDEHIAYVTSNRAFSTPFASGYRVLEQLPYREKQLRSALRERDVGALTIKKRGVAVVPEELRRRLALRGSQSATVVLTRVAGTGTALLVEPVPTS